MARWQPEGRGQVAVPGLISAGIFAFMLSWNEFIDALTFISSSEVKTVPVGVVANLRSAIKPAVQTTGVWQATQSLLPSGSRK